ncbi:VIT family protein [Candidatus Bilamarchaeum dharawalense]|uniref:VIT family protein n=1 Tax=Candidatus Bilamarchaeum dharawalense TaxID=2885759 RepID=A0A5E4LTC0_9ARCH|nr:VIT family protein [Candidatus Bilamarchaeum dharawalense]
MQEHAEQHRTGRGELFRNLILGGQDGLVNVLGIILGVAVATQSTPLVILAGLAAAFAESVSMAAVAFTSSRAEVEHYDAELKRELWEMENLPEREKDEIVQIYKAKGFSGKLLDQVVDKIISNKKVWLETMMKDELHLEDPRDGMSPVKQSILVGVSAIIGSLIPLFPFFFFPVSTSIWLGLILSFITLFVLGAYKSHQISGKWFVGGFELMIIGGAAAVAGYAVGVIFQVPVS